MPATGQSAKISTSANPVGHASLGGRRKGLAAATLMAACRADAETLCSQFIGKAPQMFACLEQNKAKLSTPRRQVVQARGG